MIVRPAPLGKNALSREVLAADKKSCRRFGPCGVGKAALYLNSFYIDRRYYVPVSSVTRVFKRVAMSRGGFTGRGIFAAIPYLVVVYDDGREKQCNFKYEDQVDQMVAYVGEHFPHIKTVSEAGEERLRQAEALRAARHLPEIPAEAAFAAAQLRTLREYLERFPSVFGELSAAAKKKRTYDRTSPAYKWSALAITLLGAAALVYGILSWLHQAPFAVYFVIIGMAVLFLFSGANVLPTGRNNRRAIERRLAQAEDAAARCMAGSPLTLSIPARYAHPVTLKRMEEAILEGRAETVAEALEIVKEDLKRLNSQVEVSQEEYDEVIAIKPMFLIHDYA